MRTSQSLKELRKTLKLTDIEAAYARALIEFCKFLDHRGPDQCVHFQTRRAFATRLGCVRVWGHRVSFQRARDVINTLCVWPDAPGERLTLLALLLCD